jgi:hypothetical protein
MKYLLGTAAFSNPDFLKTCLDSWPKRSENLERVVLFDRLIDTSELHKFHKDFSKNYPDINAFASKKHVGVAGSWNGIITLGFEHNKFDAVVIVGSDTQFLDDYFERWIKEFEAGGWEFATSKDQGFNCFALTKKCYDEVGLFDENFFPAYFEDNDYWLRVRLAGFEVGDIGDPNKFVHLGGGSSTIKRNEWYNRANSYSYSLNERYYRAKWGGHQDAPVDTKFQHPFNKPELPIKFWQVFPELQKLKQEAWEDAHKHSLE